LLQDVTPDNFLAALSGRDDLLKGVGTGKVIKRLVDCCGRPRRFDKDQLCFVRMFLFLF